MKIQAVTPEHHPKVSALLQRAFPQSTYEAELVLSLRKNGRPLHEWVCLHINKAIGYVAFSNAYQGSKVCGLHLAPMAVSPDFQKQGVGSELLRFALRQEVISRHTLFVLGAPRFYSRFGFELCSKPICPFDKNNAHFLSMRNNNAASSYVVGYEPEFSPPAPPSARKKKKSPGR